MTIRRLTLNPMTMNRLKDCFIAFDTETTGLSPAYHRIIEVGAVAFHDGVPTHTLGSVVQATLYNPCESINHISEEELFAAPMPESIYPRLLRFFQEHSKGPILLAGHNAAFDMKFLQMELERLCLDIDLDYVDTLAIARNKIILPNYKQGTIENYYGLHNQAAHRAVGDAHICGQILLRLLYE